LERIQIKYNSSHISCLRLGSGPRPVFCFHGYGEEAASFAFFEKYTGDRYTFYAIDLPFHGQTQWNEGLNFSAGDLQQILKELINQHNRKQESGRNPEQSERQKLFLLGFSLGGRVALSMYEKMPEEIEKIILLAPDGLKVNFWYWLSTQTWIGNKLFAYTMKYPYWFFSFLKALNKLKIVNASIFKFVNYYIGDKEVRQLLYSRWTGLRKLRPHPGKIKASIKRNKSRVRLIYGMYDRIILPARGKKFMKGIEGYCTLSVIHAGHQVLHEKHINEILPALLH
jgi:pimeloyl-ACP methyl ester carboxylesterase